MQVERHIRAADSHGRRKYLRSFADAYQAYESVLTPQQVNQSLHSADIVLIGDYHALPASQQFAASVIRELADCGRSVVLGLETIFSRDQHIVDEWQRGEIDESELRERIRFDLDWGYDWRPFAELLASARAHGVRVYGLDCMPRGDLRRIGARDRHAVEKIAEISVHNPEAVIVVLFGESHLAPEHLPRLLKRLLPKHDVLTVLQNIDPLYWRAAGEPAERIDAVRVSSDVICVFTSTPLEKYESYRLCLERWRQERAGVPDFAPTVYNLTDALIRYFNIDKYSATNSTQPKFLVDLFPEVCCRTTLDGIRKVLYRKRVSDEDVHRVIGHVEQFGSCYLPGRNVLFVHRFQMMHGTEEVTHFIHAACRGAVGASNLQKAERVERQLSNQVISDDYLYLRCIEEALGYFGSRVLYPARPAVRERDLYALYALSREEVENTTRFSYRDFLHMIDFMAMHKDFENNVRKYRKVPQLITERRSYSGEKREFVAQQLGAMLGSELYDAFVSGRVHKRFVRSLFFLDLTRPGAAHLTYFAIVRRTRKQKRRVVA